MATDLVQICSVCTDEYDDSQHQSVSLPCGHDFCLSCLVRLRAKGKHKCPRCRRNWAMIALPIPSGMEALATAFESDQDDKEDDGGKKKNTDDRCKKHSSPYDFWVNAKKEFYCRKCAAEDRSGVVLDVVEEAIPQIKAALAVDVTEVKKILEDDLESLDEKHANLVKKRNSVREFSKAVKALEDNFDQEIEQVAAQRTEMLNSSVELKKVEKKITNITSPADLGLAMECKNTLKRVGAPCRVPASDLLQELLTNIACSYEEETALESPPSKASFVNAMLKGSNVGPLTEGDWSASSSSNTKDSLQKKKARKINRSFDRNRENHKQSERDEEETDVNPSSRNSSKALPVKSRIQYKWQYEDDHGWTTYGQIPSTRNSSGAKTSTSDEIELHYLDDEERDQLIIKVNHVSYLLNFQTMTQTNERTQSRRKIRRIMKNDMDDHSARRQVNDTRNSLVESIYNALGYHASSDPTSYARVSTHGQGGGLSGHGSDAGNMHTNHSSAGGRGGDYNIRPGHSLNATLYKWQFMHENGCWITYGESSSPWSYPVKTSTSSNDIERHFLSTNGQLPMRIESQTNVYKLDFVNMVQLNTATGAWKTIRRVPLYYAA